MPLLTSLSSFPLQNGLTALQVASAKRGSRMYRLFHQRRSRGYNAMCQLLQRCSQKSTGPPPTHQDKPAANMNYTSHPDTQDNDTENDLMQTLLPIPRVSGVCPTHTHTYKHTKTEHSYIMPVRIRNIIHFLKCLKSSPLTKMHSPRIALSRSR